MKAIHSLIGCGRVAKNHIDGFLAAGVEFRWLCDLVKEKAERIAQFSSTAQITSDYKQVLNDPDVLSVSIAVDHGQHFQIAKDAILSDKHVLLEKPIALTLADAKEIIGLANERKKILAIVSQHRFDSLVRAIKNLVISGGIGDLTSISCTLICTREAEFYQKSYWHGTLSGEGGSALINQAYHLIDLMVWLGGEVKSVSGMSATKKLSGIIETEETFCGCLMYTNDALGTLNATITGRQMWDTRISVVGTDGDIQFDINMPNNIHSKNLTSKAEDTFLKVLKNNPLPENETPPGAYYYGTSHRRQIAEFMHAVLTNGEISVDGNEAKKTLEVILALYNSAATQSFKYL